MIAGADLVVDTIAHAHHALARRQLLRVLRAHYPGVTQVTYPQSGACRLHCYVAMTPAAEGQARNAALTAFGEDLSLKLVVVVDEDVDVTSDAEVLWAMATRMQADRDLVHGRPAERAVTARRGS